MLRIPRDRVVYRMSADNPPAARIKSGGDVVFEMNDAFGGALKSEADTLAAVDWERVNPATGPLFVEGAEPGDILKVEIGEILLDEQGAMAAIPGSGAIAGHIEAERTRILPLRDGRIIFDDRVSFGGRPMIGVIGTAPAGEGISTGTPGRHGGNMDCTMIGPGAAVYLPVNVPGALLAMGDLHAAMGDGEVLICGVEIGGAVEVYVEVVKGKKWPLPMVAAGDLMATIASADTLDLAAKEATENMLRFLTSELGLPAVDAGMLLSAIADLRICQIVDPQVTARMEFPLAILKMHGYELI